MIRLGALDLTEFRGPCPVTGDLGPVRGADAKLARRFYAFAADPSLGAPFNDGEVLVGIEDRVALRLAPTELRNLGAWQIPGPYAESTGPFSALDLVASSGGSFTLHHGVLPTCPTRDARVPAELAGLRALTLTVPDDVWTSCMDWWAVTLFLDGEDRIVGVVLRVGSP